MSKDNEGLYHKANERNQTLSHPGGEGNPFLSTWNQVLSAATGAFGKLLNFFFPVFDMMESKELPDERNERMIKVKMKERMKVAASSFINMSGAKRTRG